MRLSALIYNNPSSSSSLAPEEWIACGFKVETNHTILLGDLTLVLARNKSLPAGLAAWGFDSPTPSSICGIPTFSYPINRQETESIHPNTVTHVDHVVVYVSDVEEAKRELSAILPLRRERKDLGVHQLFFRSPEGGTIIEMIGGMEPPNRLWGLTFSVREIDATKARFFKDDAKAASKVKDARQAGRRIMTLRHEALGLHTNIAMMSPHASSSPKKNPW